MYLEYSGDSKFTIRYKKCIEKTGNLRQENIQGILFDISLM